MKRCDRCNRWHSGHDTDVCEQCWIEMGQMALFDGEYEEVVTLRPLDEWEDPRIERAEYEREFEDEGAAHPIDTSFDREREMYGKDW